MFDMTSRARGYTLSAFLCAAAVAVTACSHAQQPAPNDSSPRQYNGMRGQRGGMRGDGMFRGLDLTQDQRTKISAIRERYKPQMDSIRAQTSARDSTTRAAFRTVMTQEMGDIRGVLTADQQKKLDDRMAKMREHRHMHDGHGAPRDSTSAPPA